MAPELSVVVAAITLPFVASVATPLLYRAFGFRAGYVGCGVAAVSFGLVGSQLTRHGTVTVPWIPSLDVMARFHVDGWALLFALLASGVGVLVFWYSVHYMRGEPDLARYYAALLAFMGSILGVAFAADLIVLFLFWELTSVTSFILIGHYADDPASGYSARMALLLTVGTGLCLLMGILLIATATGDALGGRTFDLTVMLANSDEIRATLRDTGLFVPVLVLIGIAAAAKSAQVPLHFWLPNAMVAPTPVSAFLHSATMVKVGVYLIGRIRPLFIGPEWMVLFATVGLVTMGVGAVLAVRARDLKLLLAYSTASHLGLMVAGFGFRSALGAEAGVFHLFNHAVFKAALFLVAGIVAREIGSRRIERLGGLWRDFPASAAITVIAALSMAGIPPFNGFYSKELLFEATYDAAIGTGGLAWLFPITAVIASVFTVLYSLRFLGIFFGEQPVEARAVGTQPRSLIGPPLVLAGVAALVSLAPSLAVDSIIQQASDATVGGHSVVHAGLPSLGSPAFGMSAIAIAAGLSLYPFYQRVEGWIDRITGWPIRPTWWYDRFMTGIETASGVLDPVVHTGVLRSYVTAVTVAASGLALLGYTAMNGLLPSVSGIGVPPAVVLVFAVAIIAAIAMVIAPSHVAGVLTLSILGFMVAIFFILASAPDLALTQLVVETLILVVFLLVLEELPAFYADVDLRVMGRDAVVSCLVGAMAFLTVLVAGRQAGAVPTGIASYYTSQSVPGAGGTNVVNVILVDFRGIDTIGEIFVIAIAAISVLVLITMRSRGEVP